MKKDVIISVKGLQNMEDPDAEEITLETEGRFYRRNGKYFIKYEESPLTGLDGTSTVVRVEPESVTVTRTGKYPSMMMFEQGKRHMSLYSTDFGPLTVAVSTRKIDSSLTDEGGSIDVLYDVEVQYAHVGANNLKINVRSSAPR